MRPSVPCTRACTTRIPALCSRPSRLRVVTTRFQSCRTVSTTYFARLDEAGDRALGVLGRVWGAYAKSGSISPVTIDGAGVYSVSFTAGLPMETEPNDTPESANRLVSGGYLHAERSHVDDVNVFTITLPAGQYTFETSGWLDTACGFAHAADTTLELRRDDGTVTHSNTDIDAPALNFCSRITRTLEAGTYYLQVRTTGGPYYRISASK
jgi:hypothetical protein